MKRVFIHIACLMLLAVMASCLKGKDATESDVSIDRSEIPDGLKVADLWDLDDLYTSFSSTSRYKAWDLDKDGFLNEGEFIRSFYELWDQDNDGKINRSEWSTAVKNYGIDESEWAAIDPDGDGFIEMVEFDKGILGVGWYNAWDLDKDNLLTDKEYLYGVYYLWDNNGDNVLDETEYSLYDYYYLGRENVN